MSMPTSAAFKLDEKTYEYNISCEVEIPSVLPVYVTLGKKGSADAEIDVKIPFFDTDLGKCKMSTIELELIKIESNTCRTSKFDKKKSVSTKTMIITGDKITEMVKSYYKHKLVEDPSALSAR